MSADDFCGRSMPADKSYVPDYIADNCRRGYWVCIAANGLGTVCIRGETEHAARNMARNVASSLILPDSSNVWTYVTYPPGGAND
jgi:hypothetical protein